MPDDSIARALAARASVAAATPRRHNDVAEIHDFFTATNAISYEGRGFAEQWGAAKSSKPRPLRSSGTWL